MLLKLDRVPTACWVVVLSLPALVPLARAGFFASHDGLFHAYRLAALDRAVRAGVLLPRWFPEFAFGYGQPVLNFYGPLSYYWGLPLTLLGANAALALKLVFATGLIAAALAMYLFARLYWERGPALVAAVVYAYLPYHLADLYVRGAVAEFLAFVWFPLALWAFHRLAVASEQQGTLRLALAALVLAALVVTHSLSTFLFAPVLGVYIVSLLLKHGDRRATGRVALALGLAVAISAFYWLPVLAESQYVGLGHGASQGYQDHLLSPAELFSLHLAYPYPTEAGVAPTFPLGLIQVIILVAALILPLRVQRHRWAIIFFLAVALLSGLMLTTTSLLIWQLFERGLAFLQYPWRFQALTALATAFLAGALWQQLSRGAFKAPFLGQILPVAAYGCLLLWALWRLPYAPTTPDLSVQAMWQMDRDLGQVGTTWTGEYLPVWVEEQRWALSRPVPDPRPGGEVLPAGQLDLTGVGYARYEFLLDAAQATTLTLHQFHYPGWQSKGQGGATTSHPAGDLGLAAFDLPPSRGSLVARLSHTSTQLGGTLVSLVAALAVSIILVARSRVCGRKQALSLAASYLLLAAILVASLVLPNGLVGSVQAVNANLEDTAELLAFDTDRVTYHPGDTVNVTLYWRSLRTPDQDYKTFVHLTDAALTQQPSQHDGDPGSGFTPTTRWLPGELVPDAHPLTLPTDLAPGRYLLWAGMYEHDAVRNLAVRSSEALAADNRVLLGEIEVVAQ
jgi:hypothetical protein